MKILFVLENYVPHIGGVELVFKTLAENLAKEHDISIITHKLKNTKKFEVINGVKIYRVSCLQNRYLFSFLAIPKTLRLAKKADIIHTTTYNGAVPARFAAKLLGKPSIITVHEVMGNKWKSLTGMNFLNAQLHKFLEYLVISLKFDSFVCVSKSTQTDLYKNKERSVVVYNAVDYNHFNPDKYDSKKIRNLLKLEEDFVYLTYGRPGISKGIEYAVKAVPLISEKIKDSKLLLILSKDKAYKKGYDSIISLIKTLKIEEKVIISDPVGYNELPSCIKAADCVVVPSLTEGFGFTVAESCAMQKPVVATNTTSIPEVISGKFVLVEPKSPEAIGEGIVKVYHKKYNQTKLKKFLIKDNIEGYLKVYRGLIKDKSSFDECSGQLNFSGTN